MPIPKGYKRKKLVKNWKRYCTPGTIRTIKQGKNSILVCRPKGSKKTRAISIDAPKKRFGGYLHNRAAKALGWSVRDAESMSLQSLREMVRTVDPALAAEITQAIRSGSYIRGPTAANMDWLGPPPPKLGDVPADLARKGKCGEALRALAKLRGVRRDYEARIVEEMCSIGPRGASFSGKGAALMRAARKEHREHPWTTMAQAKRIARDHRKLGRMTVFDVARRRR